MDDRPAEDRSYDERVGRAMQALRKARGLTQEQMARAIGDRLGVPFRQQTVVRIEQGARPLRLAEAMAVASALGVSVDQFALTPAAQDSTAEALAVVQRIKDQCGQLDDLGGELLDVQRELLALANDPLRTEWFTPRLWAEVEAALHARPAPLPDPDIGLRGPSVSR